MISFLKCILNYLLCHVILFVSFSRDDLKKAREKAAADRERRSQERYAKKVEEERKKADAAEELIQRMEREEAELIEALKNTQKAQEKVNITYFII